MNDNDKNKFLAIMNGLADIYTADLTKVGLNMRFEALKEYSIEQVTEASNIIVKTRKYTTMPVPADFITAIEGDPNELADIQKSLVMDAINRYSPAQKFSDPITQGVIDKIGWKKIGLSTKKEMPFILKDFADMYKTYKKAASGNMISAPDEIKKLANNATKRIK